MTLLADTKHPLTTLVDVKRGDPIYRIDDRSFLVSWSADYTVTSLGTGNGYDLIVVTTSGVTQYALVSTSQVSNRRPAPWQVAPTPHAPSAPAIPITPTLVAAVSNIYAWVSPVSVKLAGMDAVRIGTSGPAFLLVHGGPEPVGMGHMHDLDPLGMRLADAGGQAFAPDYRTDTWQNARDDVAAAAAEVKNITGQDPVIVAHSFGGVGGSLAFFAGAGRAYAAINAISSAAAVMGYPGMPDPIVEAAKRPTAPVAVIRGSLDIVALSDNKDGFIAALHAAGHPGIHTVSPTDHTATLGMDATTASLMQLAALG